MTEPGTRTAWITGAGKGIGRSLAQRMAAEGWTVAVSARGVADLESLAAESAPGRIRAYPLDVADLAATRSVVERIEAEVGALDLVVLNAGTHLPVTADAFDVEAFRRLVDVNLIGVVNGLSRILPIFVERRRGHVAVVASLAGYRGLPSAAAYGATKAALINMCEALKPELERHGVRLSLINPGFVETPLTARNDFPMPFLIPVEEAAERILRGLDRGAFEIAFPRRFAFLMKILRILPYCLHFALARRMVRH